MKKLIKGGTILTSKSEFIGDILIEDEKIIAIGENIDVQAEEIYDASGKYVFPGGVDEHTHYGSFGGTLFEWSHAAAVGGTTTVVDFVPQEAGDSLKTSIEKHQARAENTASVDFAFHSMIMDPRKEVFDEVKELPKYGVSTVKCFMAYKGTPYYSDDEAILKVMQESKKSGVTMMLHCENADMISYLTEKLLAEGKTDPVNHYYARPPISEEEATERAIELAKLVDAPLFVVHVTIKEAMEKIRDAYANGYSVYGETCTHYLTLDTSYLAKPNFEGAKYVCAPPLRPTEHNHALWQGLSKGWLTAVGSDHAALIGGTEKKKEGLGNFSKIPNGAPGVQDRITMLWSQGVAKGKISKQRFVDVIATTPAKMVGLENKGQIGVGFDADIVIYDPDYRGVITQADNRAGIDYTTFEGFEMIGRPEKVFLRGQLVAENGEYVAEKGHGKRVMSTPYGLCYEHYHEAN